MNGGVNKKLERDEGIEPSPRPWQGRVLPLYESRENGLTFIAWRPNADKFSRSASKSEFPRSRSPKALNAPSVQTRLRAADLVYFQDSGGLHHGRFSLPLGEPGGAIAVDIDARELFTVFVINRDLPMAVLSSAVPAHSAGLAGLFRFRHNSSLKNYRNSGRLAQVTSWGLTSAL